MEMSGPFWPLHLQALSPSDRVFGFAAIAVYIGPMLGIVMTSAFWGRIGDRFGHKPMMIRALLGLSLTQLALAFTTDVWVLLALRFLQGACAGYIAPAQAYGVSIVSPLRRARLFAYLQVSTNIGSLAGAIAGGLILDHATFFWINLAAAVLCAACAGAVAGLLPKIAAAPVSIGPVESKVAFSPAWRSSPIIGLLAIMSILLVSRMITQTPFSLYVHAIFDVSNWIVGLCYGLLAFGFVVSASLWARHFEDKPLVQSLRHIGYVTAGCAALTALAGVTREVSVFIAIHFAWGVLLGATTPVLMSMISKSVASARQGHMLGLVQGTAQFSSIAGIALGGWFIQIVHLEYTYFLVSFFYALAVIGVVAMWRAQVTRTLNLIDPENTTT